MNDFIYIYGDSKVFFFCTLVFSLLVKYNISVAQFSDFYIFQYTLRW